MSRKAVLGVLLGGPSMESSYSSTRRPRSGARASFNKQSKRQVLAEKAGVAAIASPGLVPASLFELE